ncbi:hypothetical protein [Acinetobacter bohemicus]|uniref:hypothetical protein n=1 Tax=Acinetobacter bohemicus TaxID=1435036 RepID=UPI00192CC5A6|nr:hypothetical protein [Acinetobacter bohemicus]CAD9194010.1 hypothetical protein QAC21B_00095 [Acinetobacter bohemicus]
MPGTNTSNKTEYRDGILIPVALAAAAVVLMGTFAVVGVDGYAVTSANVGVADQTCIGIWEDDAENLGLAGATHGVVRRNKQFLVANSATDPVTQADMGQLVYIQDNQTIAKTDNSGVLPVAGAFMGFDLENPLYVWVEIV